MSEQNPSTDLNVKYIVDNGELAKACALLKDAAVLALDTEFVRTNTFYPKPGLIQIGNGKEIFLLDPLTLTEWQPFLALLSDSNITKLLHSGSEDLVLFQHTFGQLPEPLFDTQKAAAFLGYGANISYLNMVKELIGVELEKGETRSDWCARPLSERQLHYAALDVHYLPDIFQVLHQQLLDKGYLSWLQDECQQMLDTAWQNEDQNLWPLLFLNVGSAWRLNPQQLAILQQLVIWRETIARERNKPRSWIAKDAELVLLVQHRPEDRQALSALKDVSKSLQQRDGDAILAILHQKVVLSSEFNEMADTLRAMSGQPLPPALRPAIKRLQRAVTTVAEGTGIAPELLAKKKVLIEFLQSNRHGQSMERLIWPGAIDGWRRTLLQEPLFNALHDQASHDKAPHDKTSHETSNVNTLENPSGHQS